MTNEEKEQIKALIEAGDKATKGKWYEASHRKDQATIKVDGNLKLRSVNYRGCNHPTLCVLAAHLIQTPQEKLDTADFITQAANARPAIKAMAEENERLREGLEFIANGCLVPPDGGSPCFEDAIIAARQALGETNE